MHHTATMSQINMAHFIGYSELLSLPLEDMIFEPMVMLSHHCLEQQHVPVRLLYSPSMVAIGLSVRYETWPLTGWHHAFVIGWSKYRLGLPSAPLHYGLMWPVGTPTIFQTPVTVPLHSPNGRQMPAIRAVQWDCERVYVPIEMQGECWWVGVVDIFVVVVVVVVVVFKLITGKQHQPFFGRWGVVHF